MTDIKLLEQGKVDHLCELVNAVFDSKDSRTRKFLVKHYYSLVELYRTLGYSTKGFDKLYDLNGKVVKL